MTPEAVISSGPIALFGATSGIARAVSRELMRRGHVLVLLGRNEAALRAEAADLGARFGHEPAIFVWDLLDRARHADRFAALTAAHDLAGLFFAPGVLPAERGADLDAETARHTFDLNLTEPVVVLNLFARYFAERRAGFLSVLSSVAGDRGRAAQKVYGATKAGLTTYLEGLRAALHGTGVLVQTVKPGPVRTAMTAGYQGPRLLLAAPETVARDIVRGLDRGRTTVYTPGYWRGVMAVIRALPEAMARRIKN